jgi:crotonobetainyl-CoA:carnitine CoA-transferase CaiB-like acyl-CoA transferase
MGRSDLLADERFASPSARLAHQEELDTLVAAWTKDQDLFQAEEKLQARGVPASAVRTMHELYTDPQLVHRGHFVDLDHPTFGKTTVEGTRFTLSRTPARVGGSAPTLGRDNHYVLESILGYSEAQITQVVAAGVLE